MLDELMEDLTKHHALGIVAAWVYVIEFQKRGLPHAHILLIMEENSKVTTPEEAAFFISCEIPDPERNPRLHNIVKSCMIHGPRGEGYNLNSPCMVDGKCKQVYPKQQLLTSERNAKGFIVYKRPPNGPTIQVGRHEVDNRWVVPYNPNLSHKYGCHINTEVCEKDSVKYAFKYIYKGYDCANVRIRCKYQSEGENGDLEWDEITRHLDCRYVGAPESAWRFFGFKMKDASHNVIPLAVHLENEQSVIFAAENVEHAYDRAATKRTTLTSFFELNLHDEEAHQFYYHEIPEHYRLMDDKKWQRRKFQTKSLGRVYFVSPRDSERFNLRMLLHHVRGPTSFQHLRTVNHGTPEEVVCTTYKEAAVVMGLVKEDRMWHSTMMEAKEFQMPRQLRQLFALMLLFGEVVHTTELWDEFKLPLSEDFMRKYEADNSHNRALWEIEQTLILHSKWCADFQLPVPHRPVEEIIPAFDPEEQAQVGQAMYEKLNADQRAIVDEILQAIDGKTQHKQFFIYGAGGTGKTYVYRCLIHLLRGRNLKCIAVAFTGIAANLLPGGRTAHSAFKIPLKVNESTPGSIKPTSVAAEPLRQAALIIWDDISVTPKNLVMYVERLLRDCVGCVDPFGGKVIVFGGDFRQVLPVVRRLSPTEIVEASLLRCKLWLRTDVVKKLRLNMNMRAGIGQQEFSRWLLQLGRL